MKFSPESMILLTSSSGRSEALYNVPWVNAQNPMTRVRVGSHHALADHRRNLFEPDHDDQNGENDGQRLIEME